MLLEHLKNYLIKFYHIKHLLSKNTFFVESVLYFKIGGDGTPVAAYPVKGPLEVIETGVTGIMNDDLELAVKEALKLDRNKVKQASLKWSWENCWKIFEENMIEIKKN